MKNTSQTKITSKPTSLRLEQFLMQRAEYPDVLYTNRCGEVDLGSASESAVGDHGADGAIVWVLLDVSDNFDHVLVEPRGDAGELEVLTRAIDQLTAARDQLARLQGVVN